MPETEKCPECRHAPHDSLGFCPNMASDNDCACTHGAQHPAAPETETDANGLTEAVHSAISEAARLDDNCGDLTEIAAAVERIVAERVRVVEGERDAARLALGEQADIEREAFGRGVAWAMGDDEEAPARLLARAASAEAAHRDLVSRLGFGDNITEPMADNDTIVAWFDQQGRDASEWQESQLWRNDCYAAGHPQDDDCHTCDPRLALTARAESAEAAHEAEKAAHERLRAEAADVEALARTIYEASEEYNEEPVDWENHHGSAAREARRQARAVASALIFRGGPR